jgi:NTP pyrophosphatase (non-canonical NTP hydrolase)
MNPHFAIYGTPLIKLIEECSEVIQELCKAERFGLDDHNPKTKITNREAIKSEIEDVLFAIERFREWEKNIPLGSDKKRKDE